MKVTTIRPSRQNYAAYTKEIAELKNTIKAIKSEIVLECPYERATNHLCARQTIHKILEGGTKEAP